MSKRLEISEIIERFRKTHGDRYDYSLITECKDQYTKLPIVCREHGVFYQQRYVHEKGHGCPECAKIKSDNLKRSDKIRQEFIERVRKVHGDKYDLSRVVYVNQNTKIEVGCPLHGFWWTNPYTFYTGHGCPMCARRQNLIENQRRIDATGENLIERFKEVHGDKYDYSKVNYQGMLRHVEIICPLHGSYLQKPVYHLQGNGCPKCICHVSKWEQQIFEFIQETLGFSDAQQSVKGLFENNRWETDIYVPSKELGIECDGLHWHSEQFESTSIVDKQNSFQKKRLINVFEDEWNNRRAIVQSRLKTILGVNDGRVIYARKCVVVAITNKQANEFLNVNHLQGGNASSDFAFGLYCENELVSVMTFAQPRLVTGQREKKRGVYELLKFASKIDARVIGAASKLLKVFLRAVDVKEVYSFADRRWSDGALYEKLGFTRVATTKPSYFYIVDDERKHRFGFRKSVLVKQGYDANKTEKEIMQERGIYRIFDAGTYKYSMKVKI